MEREFDVQRDHVQLLQRIGALLEPGGLILFSNNFQRFRLDSEVLSEFTIEDLSRATIPEDFRRNPKIHVAYLLKRSDGGALAEPRPERAPTRK
jgi:23S rRNA (guanine2445-N2)-methyltransferase / 23S rRNA (guanine2069-N7)-methyltransferase